MRFLVMKDGKSIAHLSPCPPPPPPMLLEDIANQSLHSFVASEFPKMNAWSSGLLLPGKVYHFVPLERGWRGEGVRGHLLDQPAVSHQPS